MDTQETESSVLISTNVQMVPITAQLMVVALTPTEALHEFDNSWRGTILDGIVKYIYTFYFGRTFIYRLFDLDGNL